MLSILNIKKTTFAAALVLGFAASSQAKADPIKIVDFSFGKKEGAILLETSGPKLSRLVIEEPISSDAKLDKLEPTRRSPVGSTSFKWLFIELLRLESENFSLNTGGDIEFIVPGKLTETGREISIEAELKKTRSNTWYFEYENELAYALAIKKDDADKKVASFEVSTLACERDSIEAYAEKTKSVDLLKILDCDQDTKLSALTYLMFVAPDLVNSSEGRSLKTNQIQNHRDTILKLAEDSSDYEVQRLIQEATNRGYLEVADKLMQD